MNKKILTHTERLNFMVSPKLKRSIKIAAHANQCGISDYIRWLIYNDLMANSELTINDVNKTICANYVVHKIK